MKFITPLTIDSLDVFGKIVLSKNVTTQATLKHIFSHVKSRYSEYSMHQGDLRELSLSSLGAKDRDALLQCYLSETKELKRMKASIKANHIASAGMKCQFCGIEIISTYDHYVPKETHPEFSVHAHNLIPCCSTCNNKKRMTFLTNLGERAIINLYYDAIPNDRYLFSKIEFKNNVPVANFYLQKPSSHSECLFRLVSEHYSKLDLVKRYRENAAEILSEARASIISHAHPDSDAVVKGWLTTEAENFSKQYSENHWKVALFTAMAESDEYISSCL